MVATVKTTADIRLQRKHNVTYQKLTDTKQRNFFNYDRYNLKRNGYLTYESKG